MGWSEFGELGVMPTTGFSSGEDLK